jgi:hypothetical protein
MGARKQRAYGAAVALVAWLAGAPARADCTKDVECKGERICEQGRCVDPPRPPPTPPQLPSPPPSGARDEVVPPASTPPVVPLSVGIDLDFGAASVFPAGASSSLGFDGRFGVEVSGGHFGALIDGRLVVPVQGTGVTDADETLLIGVDFLGRYYFYDKPFSPYVSAGLAWLDASFQPAGQKTFQSAGSSNDASGAAASLGLGAAVLRTSFVHPHLEARVDVPFFSLKDSQAGQTHWFWAASLVAGVAVDYR